jgi:signal transduction histidine kinase
VPARLLAEATGVPAIELEECLTAAVEDGLLAIQQGDRVVLRMRHDRVQQAVYGALAPAQRRERHLSLARRLAASGSFRVAAAQQYLPAAEDIREPRECRRVARLMHDIAARMQAAADFAAAEVLLAAALSLLARLRRPTRDDESLRAAMEVQRHVTLCSLGRFEDADALYRTIEARGAAVEDWVDAVCAQVDSLQNRSRPADAIKLGLGVLSRLGVDVPVDFAGAEVDARVKTLNQWAEDVVPGDDPRPYTGDRRVTAQSRLLHRLTYPAYFYNIRIEAWLIAQAQDLWARFGPSPDLVHALAAMGAAVIILSGNYRSGYRGARHALAISESRGWEPGTSTARLQFAVHVSNWFDPLEETLRQLHLARAGAQRNGEVQSTCFSYRPSSTALMDCSPTIQGWAEETEAGLVFASRIRNEYVVAMMTIERQLIAALRAEPQAEVALPEGASACVERQAKLPAVSLSLHFARAFLAAVFDDDASFPGHAARAMEHVGVVASYRVATVRLLNDLALARRVRSASGAERAKLLEQLDAGCEWMAARAADGPANFAHLSEWLKAERAWAAGDVARSAAAFDVALGRAESAVRCWHRAMIAERAGLFHLEQGMGRSGRQFIREARDAWRAWGAPAKVRHMERAHEFLRADIVAARAGGDESPMGVDTLDMLAIVRASQALSSETSLVRLKRRIADVTAALTGATGVQFALWDSDANDWTVSDGETPQAIGAEEAGRRGLLPLAALRYAERTREPLVVADAADDDRFSRDPYFAGLGHASLLAVPVLSQGSVRAMLLLENRLSRGAFSTAHLDAVSLIAGQLAVSLDNALLYDRLEQRVREQTRELVDAARRAGMAQIATNVLHNVGNVLNSVNTSSRLIRLQVLESRGARVTDLADLLERHANDLDKFFASGGKGRVMPVYVRELAVALAAEREEMLGELRRLDASIEHINNVVAMQQSYAGTSGMLERASISTLVDDALGLQEDAFARQGVAVARDYAPAEPLSLDKTRVMQILVNLLENARQAMEQTPAPHKLRISVRQDEAGATVKVSDNGCGITRDNLARMFSHGFTTKPGGHGFGLHSCAVAAREMGGSLTVQSEGEGAGATFTLCLPPGGVRESSAS